ncbi:amidophosphoribosyltransferase [Komagataeibacter xylinus]|uniref:Amidophosphoribosyltransferase n=1 Tax=Komagataeibacter xylinus TaxID=28448 RepID=A0A318PWM0_KOMXY|nr:ComF family protein [Komagataeibacter xylinus]PYD58096.1 amidophosphoribosyltransferase [Komagataeibacter xylinus]GBQ67421.1 competence protein F [Komagataeibacter xylinus NBRC 15237]
MTRSAPWWRKAATPVLDLLFPPRCLACGAEVAQAGHLCGACVGQMHLITPPFCRRCALPFSSRAAAGPDMTCTTCQQNPPPWREARAAMMYDETARSLILPLKYADSTENVSLLARYMAKAGRDIMTGESLFMPVPLHRLRLFGRRYNQAALLARALARLAGATVLCDGLERIHATRPLEGLGRSQRQHLMHGAITVRPERIPALSGRHVIVVDDVMTTGATLAACAVPLLAAGATRVDVLAAARASGQHAPQ